MFDKLLGLGRFHVVYVVTLIFSCSVAIGVDYHFINGTSLPDMVGARYGDGFLSQIVYVRALLEEGGVGLVLSNPLTALHLLRTAVTAPFVGAQDLAGPSGVILLFGAMMYPLASFHRDESRVWTTILLDLVRIAPLLLAVFVSGRTVLVAIGAGYIVMGVVSRSRDIWLILGVPLVAFSSAAVAVSALFVAAILFLGKRASQSRSLIALLAALAVVLSPSFLAKADGFASGAEGYETYAQESFFELVGILPNASAGILGDALMMADRILSRSTIFVSFAYGQTYRLALYLAMAAAAIWYLAYSLYRRQFLFMTIPVSTFGMGLFLEGLGAWVLLWPIIWAFTGPDRPLLGVQSRHLLDRIKDESLRL